MAIDPNALTYTSNQISMALVDYTAWPSNDLLREADRITLQLLGQAQGATAQFVASLAAAVVNLQSR